MDSYSKRLNKINRLNKLIRINIPFSKNIIVSTLIDDNKKNKKRLEKIGASLDDISKMKCEDMLDTRLFAFEKLGANRFVDGIGFTIKKNNTKE